MESYLLSTDTFGSYIFFVVYEITIRHKIAIRHKRESR